MKQNYDDNELDRLFRDKLAGEEAAPRGMVWDKIEKQLDGAARRPTGWIWWLSGIILVVGIGTWLGVSAYGNKSKVTGWNYNDPAKSDFDKVPYNAAEGNNGNSVVTIKNGASSTADSASVNSTASSINSSSANAADSKNGNSSADNSSAKKSLTQNPTDKKIAASQNNSNTIFSDSKSSNSSDKNSGSHKNSIQRKPSLAKSDVKSSSIYSDKSTFEKGDQPDQSSGLVIKGSDSPDKKSTPDDDSKDAKGNSHEGSTFSLPKKLGDFNKPADSVLSNFPSLLTKNNMPADSSEKNQKGNITPPNSTLIHPSDSLSKNVLAKNDSAKLPGPDSASGISPALPPLSPLPVFYFALHGSVDNGKILSATESDENENNTDVHVYDKNKLKSLPQQTYSYGARFGWFLTKRISLTAGAYYSIFQSAPSEGHFKFDHNNAYTFTMYSPTSSVKCKSTNFTFGDSNGGVNDTFYVGIRSEERYDYLNLQLGLSYYAIRTKHFGVYADLLSNGAYLAKEEMTLSVPKSGKTLQYGANRMSGMNKFVMGGQTGIGVEFLFGGHFGLWAEPSFYFSGALNKANAVNLQPGGMRYLFGLAYHF